MDTADFRARINTILPGVDIDKGLQLSVYNMENYKRALYCAMKSIRFKLPLLDSMIESGEYDGLRVITHTLCQLLMSIGAEGLAQRGYALEKTAFNESIPVLQEEVIGYRNELAYFMAALEEAIHMLDSLSGSKRLYFNYSPSEARQILKDAFPVRSQKIS